VIFCDSFHDCPWTVLIGKKVSGVKSLVCVRFKGAFSSQSVFTKKWGEEQKRKMNKIRSNMRKKWLLIKKSPAGGRKESGEVWYSQHAQHNETPRVTVLKGQAVSLFTPRSRMNFD
jgi:hypothetical protein